MQSVIRCLRSFRVVVTVALLALATVAWGQGTGTGKLNVDVDPNTPTAGFCSNASGTITTESPNKFIVSSDSTLVHVSITPAFPICVSGDDNKINSKCSNDTECASNFKCTGPAGGKTCNNGPFKDQSCTLDSQCNNPAVCKLALECSDGLVFIHDDANDFWKQGTFTAGSGGNPDRIDLCYPINGCVQGPVGYCKKQDTGNARFLANASIPKGEVTFGPAHVKVVDCGGGIPTCTNQVGSLCCGLTQGAYGAPNSVATCSGTSCNPITGGQGYLIAGPNAFAGDSNATTIGVHFTKSITIDNLATLIAYLPSSGTPGSFNNSVTADTHYSSPSGIPDVNKQLGGSRGEGGGTLSGNAMACSLNSFLSGTLAGNFSNSTTPFTPSGFGTFVLPSAGTLLCTRRSGPDKVLLTGDDICQAFSYPTCAAGLAVNAVLAMGNSKLAGNNGTCTASELNVALDNINNQFDQCGLVIDCGAVTTPGVFTCPPLQ